ncbi:MAG: transglutaminase domain-containing protein [Halobacteriota archaeon]
MLPLDSAANTLKRGTGACYHLVSLFNALCRAAGIKARCEFCAMSYERSSTSSRHGVASSIHSGTGCMTLWGT